MKNLLERFYNKLNSQEGFVKAVSLLAGGTAFAHVITMATLPLVTRLYTPDDFSKLAVYTSLLSILAVIGCLRYEVAIPLPKDDKQAELLLIISIIISIAFSFILLLIMFVFNDYIESILGNGYFKQITWILPLGVLAASLYSAFKFWSTRIRDFKSIAKTKIQQSSTSVLAQLLLGFFGFTTIGLLLGQLLYSSAGVSSLFRKKNGFRKVSIKAIKQTCSRYIHYPKYSVGEALFNTAGVHLPILIIASVAAPEEAGYLLLASKIMIIPMVLIGTSMSQVYYAHANEHHYNNNLASFTYDCMKKLAVVGFAPILLLGLIAPIVFPLAFGSEWERAGKLVAWMTPWFIMQFIVSPVSMSLHVNNNQKLAVLLQFFGLTIKVLIVWLAFLINDKFISEAYAISGFVFYLLYFIVIVKVLNIEYFYRIIFNKKVFAFVAAILLLFIFIYVVMFYIKKLS